MNKRINTLKAMHEAIMMYDNEEYYFAWIVTCVPDCPQEDDFEFIAEDEEEYQHCVDTFNRFKEEIKDEDGYEAFSNFENFYESELERFICEK